MSSLHPPTPSAGITRRTSAVWAARCLVAPLASFGHAASPAAGSRAGSAKDDRAAPGRSGPPAPVAIVGAMREELRALLALADGVRTLRLGGRDFHSGRIGGQRVVLVLSGIGKVAAATTTTLLAQVFKPRALVFTGVAGGLGDARVGDVVVAAELLQHDMDASPLFPQYEVPLTGRSRFAADVGLSQSLADAAGTCLADPVALLGAEHARAFALTNPRVHRGLVISGDRFVSTGIEAAALARALPDALAVEMEGAALAQVATDFGLPFAVLRSISDRADDSAHVDFPRFIAEVASVYSARILDRWLSARA